LFSDLPNLKKNMSDAIAFFNNELHPDDIDDEECVRQLAQDLEYMPLGIVQAIVYIPHSRPQWSMSKHLQNYKKSERSRKKLLEHVKQQKEFCRDWQGKNSILITWQMSFDHIRAERESAANLSSPISFLDRQGIHRYLLCNCEDGKPTEGDEDSSNASGLDDSF
jgi:hypothetical protein